MTKMDKLSEKAAREWRADARAAHDDPLLDCLVEITRLHGVTATAQALSSGLPLEEHRLTPALLPRAAAGRGSGGALPTAGRRKAPGRSPSRHAGG